MRFVACLEFNKEEIPSILSFERVFVVDKEKVFCSGVEFSLKNFSELRKIFERFFLFSFRGQKKILSKKNSSFTFLEKILFITK